MKKRWYDYLWVVSLTYLILGFFNILFAWLGLFCFFIPLIISVAKGTNNINSDIDIVVDSHLKGLKFIGLLEDVKQAINMDVDLFDISYIEKASLVEEEIKRTGVLIYEK